MPHLNNTARKRYKNSASRMPKCIGGWMNLPASLPTECVTARNGIIWPDLPNHQLNTLADYIGHKFQHHQAKADAEAAGRVLLAMMKHVGANTPRELLQKAEMDPRRFARPHQGCK